MDIMITRSMRQLKNRSVYVSGDKSVRKSTSPSMGSKARRRKTTKPPVKHRYNLRPRPIYRSNA